MAAILNSANLNSTILDSAILVFPLKLTHTCQHWFPPFVQKKLHSFILTQLDNDSHLEFCMLDSDTAILDSDTLLSFLRFTPKHPHSTLTLTHTNSIWLKFIPSHLTWWRQPSWILASWIQLFCTKKLHLFILTQLDDVSHLELCHIEFSHLGFSHFTPNSDSN